MYANSSRGGIVLFRAQLRAHNKEDGEGSRVQGVFKVEGTICMNTETQRSLTPSGKREGLYDSSPVKKDNKLERLWELDHVRPY